MPNKAFVALLQIIFISIAAAQQTASAIVIATDNASDAAYSDGWAIGDNGGSGFGPWDGPGSYGGPESVMEIDVAPAETDNDLGSSAFRIGTGGFFGAFQVERPFSTPMSAGQSFSVDYDSYLITGEGEPRDIAISLRSAGGERFAFYAYYYNDGTYVFGSNEWGVNAATAFDNLNGGAPLPENPLGGIVYTSTYTTDDGSDGFKFTLDLPTIDTYRLRVFEDDVTKLDVSGELKNGAAVLGQGISSVRFFGSETSFQIPETGGVAYFNNLQISEVEAGLTGDYNDDGKVDAADYVLWRKNPGEYDGDPQGYLNWRANFGAAQAAGFASSAHQVPEPSVLIALVLAVAGVGYWRTRRR
jgi:hypothetical protein